MVSPNEITRETAGPDWLALKAAALSLQIQVQDDKSLLRSLIICNIVLAAVLFAVVTIWQPTFVFYAVIVAVALWIALALFILITGLLAVRRVRRKTTRQQR